MKKIFVYLLVGLTSFSLIACGSDTTSENDMGQEKVSTKNNSKVSTEIDSENEDIEDGQTEIFENTQTVERISLSEYFSKEFAYDKKELSIPYLNREITNTSSIEDLIWADDYYDDEAYYYKDEKFVVSDNADFEFWCSKNSFNKTIFRTNPNNAYAEFEFFKEQKSGTTNIAELMQEGNWGINLENCDKYFAYSLDNNEYGSNLAGLGLIHIMEETLGKPDHVYVTNEILIKEHVTADAEGNNILVVYKYDNYVIFFEMFELFENGTLSSCELSNAYICSESFMDKYINGWRSEYRGEYTEIELQ